MILKNVALHRLASRKTNRVLGSSLGNLYLFFSLIIWWM